MGHSCVERSLLTLNSSWKVLLVHSTGDVDCSFREKGQEWNVAVCFQAGVINSSWPSMLLCKAYNERCDKEREWLGFKATSFSVAPSVVSSSGDKRIN